MARKKDRTGKPRAVTIRDDEVLLYGIVGDSWDGLDARSLIQEIDALDKRAGDSLVTAVGKWRERDLDKYRLPHPVLGKISVREMLFFTHYHDLHHLEIVRRAPS